MPQTYSITAPNGKTLDITGDHVPTEAELHEIFAKAGVDTATPVDTALPRDARGRPVVSSDLSESPSTVDKLNEMLGPLAHPQTLTDFARLLTMPVDAVRKAAASALAMAAARPAAGAAIHATGTGLEKAGTLIDKPSRYVGAAEVVTDPKRALLTLVAPSALRSTGRLLQRAGTAIGQTAPAVGEASPVVAPAAAEAVEAAPTIGPTGTGATYQAGQQAASSAPAAEQIVKASGKMQLTAPEFKEFQRLLKRGMSLPEAEQAVKTARDLAERLGATPPPVSATKFPKGWGKSGS